MYLYFILAIPILILHNPTITQDILMATRKLSFILTCAHVCSVSLLPTRICKLTIVPVLAGTVPS